MPAASHFVLLFEKDISMNKKMRFLFIFATVAVAILAIVGIIFYILKQQPKVVNAQGDPIEGAFLISGEDYAITDQRGAWEQDRLSEGQITIIAQGYEDLITTESKGKIELTAKPAETVLTFVYDDNGPLDDAYIFPLDSNSYEVSGLHRTNEEGLAFFPEFPQDWTLFLIYKEGYELGWTYANITPENDNSLLIKLEKSTDSVTLETPESPNIQLIKTAHAQEAPQEPNGNINIKNPGAAISEIAVLQAQVSQLLEQIQKLQAQMNEKEAETTPATRPPINVNSGQGTLHQWLNQIHIDSQMQYVNGNPTGFFGPMTSSSLSKWNREKPMPTEGFFGTVSRSKYQTLVTPLPPPPTSPSDVTIVTGRNVNENGEVTPIPPGEIIVTPVYKEYEVQVYDGVITIPEQAEPVEIDLDLSDIKLYEGQTEITKQDAKLIEGVKFTVKDLEELIEKITADPESEEPIEYQFMCCYDPAYPDAPYFLPFAGDDCSIAPGAYEVQLGPDECANEFIVY